MAFQSCRLHIASVTIADAAIFIVSLLLLFSIIDISHARTWKDNIAVVVVVVSLPIVISCGYKTDVKKKRKRARNLKSTISRRSFRNGSRNVPTPLIELILSVASARGRETD